MARRSSGRDIVSTVFLWFMAALMIVGTAVGIKWVLNNDFGGQTSESEVTSLDSEEPGTSEEIPITEDPASEDLEPEPPLNPQPNGLYLMEFNKEIVFNSGDSVRIINSYGGEEVYGTITKTNKILFKPHIDIPNPRIYFTWLNDAGDVFEYDENLMIGDFQLGVNVIELSNDEATMQVSYRPFVASDLEGINEFYLLPTLESAADFIDASSAAKAPLIKSAYRSSDNYGDIIFNNKNYKYNSLIHTVKKDIIDDVEYIREGIGFGFPSDITKVNTQDIFNLGFTYTSYLMQNFEVRITENLFINGEYIMGENTGDFFLVYRNSDDLVWKSQKLQDDLTIEADNNYYQFAIAYATNNKTNKGFLTEFTL